MSGKITDDVLKRYVSGKATMDEIAEISIAMSKSGEFRGLVELLESLDGNGLLSQGADLPMASAAAASEGNLCDVLCEQYILKEYFGDVDFGDCMAGMADNCWLKESGTPLHNIGRLLEQYGMSVSREYDRTIDDLHNCLARRYKLIAVVDYGQFSLHQSDGIFHAVVCLNAANGVIRIFDPATNGTGNHLETDFELAWACSHHYLVSSSTEGMEYHPHPIDVSDVDLDDSLMELSEAIAENAHEIWSSNRYNDGWRYGTERNDTLKLHPDMIPYSELSEGEKNYDRYMALNTIRLVKKLGFTISPKKTRYCPNCGTFLSDNDRYCPECGCKQTDD